MSNIDYETFWQWACEKFGEDNCYMAGSEVCINSPFVPDYDPDRGNHLWCNPSKGIYHCWKTNESGTLIRLVMEMEGCEYPDAQEILGGNRVLHRLQEKLEAFLSAKQKKVEKKPVAEASKNLLSLPPDTFKIAVLSPRNRLRVLATEYLEKRKIPVDGLYICASGKYAMRIIIPYYNSAGQLIYFNGRDITNKAKLRYRGPEKEVGVGKCFGKDTPIMMYDGTIKLVQDVQENDLVMGPDSQPRIVYGKTSGYGKLFKITPLKGESYIVNEDHILVLYRYKKGKFTMPVKEFLSKNKNYQRNTQSYRAAIDFCEQSTLIDPYIFGLWLGDGHSGAPAITNKDSQIIEAWYKEADNRNLKINIDNGPSKNCPSYHMTKIVRGSKIRCLVDDLRELKVWKNKHIPDCYLHNSREVRLKVLAGYLDTDGSLSNNCFDFVTKHKTVADGIAYIARSLGFACYVKNTTKCCQNGYIGEYYRGTISGIIDEIPVKIPYKKPTQRRQIKDVLKVGFKIDEIGYGDYYGFKVNKDHLFLLGDFTVVHNSDVVWMKEWPAAGATIHLCEGEFDAMSLCQAGFNGAAAGGKEFGDKQLQLIKQYNVTICFDLDKYGLEALNKVGAFMRSMQFVRGAKNDKISYIRPAQGYKDWNDMLVKLGAGVVHGYVKERERILEWADIMKLQF